MSRARTTSLKDYIKGRPLMYHELRSMPDDSVVWCVYTDPDPRLNDEGVRQITYIGRDTWELHNGRDDISFEHRGYKDDPCIDLDPDDGLPSCCLFVAESTIPRPTKVPVEEIHMLSDYTKGRPIMASELNSLPNRTVVWVEYTKSGDMLPLVHSPFRITRRGLNDWSLKSKTQVLNFRQTGAQDGPCLDTTGNGKLYLMEAVKHAKAPASAVPTIDPALLARAQQALRYDLQESNAFIHGVIKDLLKALGAGPSKAPKPQPKAPKPQPLTPEEMAKLPTIGDFRVKGDRGIFTIRDIISPNEDNSFMVAEDVGYCSIEQVALLVLDQLKRRFGVVKTRMEESESREGGLFVEFKPPIPPEREKEYLAFLGHKE